MDTIDLDAILREGGFSGGMSPATKSLTKRAMIKAVNQALVLASEKAETTEDSAGNKVVDKQSILDVERLIK